MSHTLEPNWTCFVGFELNVRYPLQMIEKEPVQFR